MIDWLRFAAIVLVVAVDDLLRELMMSYTTTRDFFRYRVRYIVQEKWRLMWRR
jgi:hypothetical protein